MRLLVYTLVSVLLPLIVTTVVIYCCVRLLTDPDWAAVASDASVEVGLEELVVVDWTPAGVWPWVGKVLSWSSACDVDGRAAVAEGDGLSFKTLVLCTSTVGDANTGVLADDGVSFANELVEVAAIGGFDGEAEAEAPVPTGGFCRY